MEKFPNRLMVPTKTKVKASSYIGKDLMPLLKSILRGNSDYHIQAEHKLHKDIYLQKIQQILKSGVFDVIPYRLKAQIRAQKVRSWGVQLGVLSDLFYNSSGNAYSYIKPQIYTRFYAQTSYADRNGERLKNMQK